MASPTLAPDRSSHVSYEVAKMRRSLFDQGYLDEQFYEIEQLQDDVSPNFVEEVVTSFITDSTRQITCIEKFLEKTPCDFMKLNKILYRLKGSSSSIGAARVRTEGYSLGGYCDQENIEGCIKSFEKLKREHAILKQKMENYFLVVKQLNTVKTANHAE